MKNVLYVHGAGQSKRSFEFMRKHLPEHTAYMPEYTMDRSVDEIIRMYYDRCVGKFEDAPINVIGHSLGGIVALHLLDTDLNIEKAVTLSAPFGGIEGGEILRLMFPFHKLYNDVRSSSDIISDLKRINKERALGLVSVEGGIPLIHKPNDGAVTVESQLALEDMDMLEIQANHFEILMSQEVCDKIANYLAL